MSWLMIGSQQKNEVPQLPFKRNFQSNSLWVRPKQAQNSLARKDIEIFDRLIDYSLLQIISKLYFINKTYFS